MASYVLSDIHGHLVPLLRALDEISPTSDDAIYILGDMVDRGPDPVGVMKLCRSLPNTVVLLGNHEQMMLECLCADDDSKASKFAWFDWLANGGTQTVAQLAELDEEDLAELIVWVQELPLYTRCQVNNTDYVLVHAGLQPGMPHMHAGISGEDIDAMLAAQKAEDLVWIRNPFWSSPTGLVDEQGTGPIVIAGHTPTPLVEHLADKTDRSAIHDGLCRMLSLGACEKTAGIADRIAIDCGAGAISGAGRIMVLRLDDMHEFYQEIRPGE